MNDIYDKTRLVVAKRTDEDYPFVIGGLSEMSSGIIDQGEWDGLKRGWAEKWLGPDAGSYEFMEVVVTIPNRQVCRTVVPMASLAAQGRSDRSRCAPSVLLAALHGQAP